jgi:hypothetical protein
LEVPDKDEQGRPTDNPEEAMTWQTVTDPKDIKTRLLQRNIAHFGQANEKIFASEEFQRAFGYTGTGDLLEKLVRGEYISPSMGKLSKGAKHLLQKLGNK